jgi:hypothetical protein
LFARHDIWSCYRSRFANPPHSPPRVPILRRVSGHAIFQDTARARELEKTFYFHHLTSRSPKISPRKKNFWTALHFCHPLSLLAVLQDNFCPVCLER